MPSFSPCLPAGWVVMSVRAECAEPGSKRSNRVRPCRTASCVPGKRSDSSALMEKSLHLSPPGLAFPRAGHRAVPSPVGSTGWGMPWCRGCCAAGPRLEQRACPITGACEGAADTVPVPHVTSTSWPRKRGELSQACVVKSVKMTACQIKN